MLPHLRDRLGDNLESDDNNNNNDDNDDNNNNGEEKEEEEQDPIAKRFWPMTVCKNKKLPR